MKSMKPISEKSPISNLLSDTLSLILSLLPTKSILTCKLVCKLWCSIIRNPHFSMSSKSIALFVRSIEHNKNSHLVEPQVDHVFVKERNGDLCLVLGEKSAIKLNDGGFGGYPVEMLSIVNSCKGLLCFTIGSLGCSPIVGVNYDGKWVPFVVCNSVTSDYVVIERPASIERACHCGEKQAGLGFSSKSDQYKLARFFSDENTRTDEGPLVAEVYTLGSDEKWREVENRPPQGYIWCKNATFFEGWLHWIVVHCKTSIGRIAAFDCWEEIFVVVDLPSDLVNHDLGKYRPMMDLAVLQSQLCFCIWNPRVSSSHIWVMNEYGVKKLWRKLFVVSSGDSPDYLMPFEPLGYLNNGEILMLSVLSELVLYNVGSNTWHAIKIFGVDAMAEALLFDPIFLSTKNLLIHGEPPKAIVTGIA